MGDPRWRYTCMSQSEFGLNPWKRGPVLPWSVAFKHTGQTLASPRHRSNTKTHLSIVAHPFMATADLCVSNYNVLNKTMTMAASQMAPTVRGRPTGVSQSLKIQKPLIMFWICEIWKLCCKYVCKYVLGQASQKWKWNRDGRCVQQNKRGFNVQPSGISMAPPPPYDCM